VFNVGEIVSRSGRAPVDERNPDRRIVVHGCRGHLRGIRRGRFAGADPNYGERG
jgi:hypothetical protein